MIQNILEELLKSRVLSFLESLAIKGRISNQLSSILAVYTPDKPTITFPDKPCRSYYVIYDPPHLLKNACNMLIRPDKAKSDNSRFKKTYFPGFNQSHASWDYVTRLFELDRQRSVRLAPKLRKKHVYRLISGSKMKVKLATQVLSNTVSSALDLMVSTGVIDASASATSSYLKLFNDIFDVFNSSSPKSKNHLNRPLTLNSKSMDFIKSKLATFHELNDINYDRRVQFIKGWIQNIDAVCSLMFDLNK